MKVIIRIVVIALAMTGAGTLISACTSSMAQNTTPEQTTGGTIELNGPIQLDTSNCRWNVTRSSSGSGFAIGIGTLDQIAGDYWVVVNNCN